MTPHFLLFQRLLWFLGISLILIPINDLLAQQITWTTLALPIAAADRYDDIFFISPQVGWAIDGGEPQSHPPIFGRIYKTTDGGSNWTLQFDSSKNYLRSIRFVDSLHGWAGTLGMDSSDEYPDTTILYETTDGGTSWSVADSKIMGTKPAGLCGMFAVDSDNIYVCGKYSGPAYILKTTNGGRSWQSIDMNSYAGGLVDLYFWSRDSGIVVGGTEGDATSDALILFTSDGGDTWSQHYLSDTSEGRCWKVSFPTGPIGTIVPIGYSSIETEEDTAHGTYYLKTSDNGISWERETLNPSEAFYLQGIGFITPNIGWAGGWGSGLYTTSDGGSIWSLSNDANNINRFRFFGDTLGYCAGAQVYKIIVTQSDAVKLLPDSLKLSTQNNPNPFQDITQIHFTLPREEHVTINLFDLEGKKISNLIDGEYSYGEHSVPCCNEPGIPIPSGTYIYELTSEDGSIERQIIRLQ